jgi:DNA-binding IclR family transcriptional regulator
MAIINGSSNKAKIAKRVIEVLEYFDDNHREATVMDIVRRYNRPQSSTSELLSSLVELGLLYKDPYSRSYSLSPRASLLGSSGQSGIVRDGRLVRLVDRLAAQTGLSVALFGMVGLNTQIVSWRSGARCTTAKTRALFGGMQEPLIDSAAGLLLLSTVAQPRCDGMVRRLIAEASDDRKVPFAEVSARLQYCRDGKVGIGAAGFTSGAEVVAMLLPDQPAEHPLAIGLVYSPENQLNTATLAKCIEEAIEHCLRDDESEAASVAPLLTAA